MHKIPVMFLELWQWAANNDWQAWWAEYFIRMTEINEQLPYDLEALERKKLQSILERFGPVFPFPLLVITLEGITLASSESTSSESSPSICLVDRTCDRVIELEGDAEGRELLASPILVHNDLLGYVAVYHPVVY